MNIGEQGYLNLLQELVNKAEKEQPSDDRTGVVVHLYSNHLDQAKLQLSRKPYDFPKLKITKKGFFDYEMEDFSLVGYQSHGVIKADVAV